jgi:ribosomal protein S27AE
MAVLVADRIVRPPSLFGPGPAGSVEVARTERTERDGGLGGGLTLDEAIVGAWEGLVARATVACPLCGGVLRPHAAGGRCGDCGTSLD